ncbi:MAG: hypothetical protein E7663_07765 [Ruminococcaceae bacterium]|nr:hypothetical protein [Oscillospiraceae bacterium]
MKYEAHQNALSLISLDHRRSLSALRREIIFDIAERLLLLTEKRGKASLYIDAERISVSVDDRDVIVTDTNGDHLFLKTEAHLIEALRILETCEKEDRDVKEFS